MESQNEWLYNDGQNATRGVYNERITAIKNKVANVVKRYDTYQSTLQELYNLDGTLKSNFEYLNSLVHFLLFRIKNTNISHLKNDKKDITLSPMLVNGHLMPIKFRRIFLNMNL